MWDEARTACLVVALVATLAGCGSDLSAEAAASARSGCQKVGDDSDLPAPEDDLGASVRAMLDIYEDAGDDFAAAAAADDRYQELSLAASRAEAAVRGWWSVVEEHGGDGASWPQEVGQQWREFGDDAREHYQTIDALCRIELARQD